MSSSSGELFAADQVDRPEIVVGVVGALGVDLDVLTRELKSALLGVAYSVNLVRVSELIEDFCTQESIEVGESATDLDRLMDLGDALRKRAGTGAATAALVVGDITRDRPAITGEIDPGGTDDDVEAIFERNAHATIVRQLKHPKEVEALRTVYGPRFVLVGAWAPEKDRRRAVDRRLRSKHPTEEEGWYAQHVAELLARDERDAHEREFGQRVRDTYALADFYVAMVNQRTVRDQVTRLVALLFGSPFETPQLHEQAMFHASGASLRSSDAGRQVGAVIVDYDGDIVVTGTNEVPRPGGGQYWPDDSDDRRDFQYGFDVNESQKAQIIVEVLCALRDEGWLQTDYSELDDSALGSAGLTGPLAASRVGDLLEFGRVAHAEMAAICTAARRGTAIRGLTMYTTTYPCHECARLIITAGIMRVVYVDPYPKSQVATMYQHEISEDLEDSKRVIFEPYRGVAPRMYRSVFVMTGRKRDSLGRYPTWEPATAKPRLVADATAVSQPISAEKSFYEGTMKKLMSDVDAGSEPVAKSQDH